ncbi:MAG: hypothetical protein ACE5LU_01480 [Anaerolineae bacterium]
MPSIATMQLKLPARSLANQREQLQRSLVYHLLRDGRVTMPEALGLFSPEDQAWLVETLLQDVEESLFLTSQISDVTWRQRFWQQYNDLLGHLFHWHDHWSEHHGELLAILRTVARRYSQQDLTPEQFEVMQALTRRLREKQLYREDIFSATCALRDVGLDTLLDLSPVADQLFASYLAELDRARP